MNKILSDTAEIMHNAVSLEPEQSSRDEFSTDRELPVDLSFLNTLSGNFYWSWHDECASLFRDIDPGLWYTCEQNPRLFLRDLSEIRIWEKAADHDYLERIRKIEEEFLKYTAVDPTEHGAIDSANPVAYFCAEYGIHNSLPIYSGGLGILAGDHLKSASDLNIPFVGVGLMYRFGYFRQNISHDGWQEEHYADAFESERALEPVLDENGERLMIRLTMRGREVCVRVWLARVGRISLYLLDTSTPENDPVDRYITGHLYGGDSETRIVQELVLGIGGVRVLRALGIEPSVFHLNEGHSAFLTLELARESLLADPSSSFVDAMAAVRDKCVFTTHTPVDAGNDTFEPQVLKDCFGSEYLDSLKLPPESFFELGRTDPEDETEWFGMTPLAIRMSRSANGVSKKHGEVSRELWRGMFPVETAAESVPITSVTNGVHAPTWIDPLLKDVYVKHIGPDWMEVLRDRERWNAAVDQIPDKEIWRAHSVAKNLLISLIREKTLRKNTGDEHTINEHRKTTGLFDPEVLTIGFARRIAAYKRWNLIMSDLERLLKMVDDEARPVQFVFAGKAHPQDRKAKRILRELLTINHDSSWQQRAVFLAGYDQQIARHLVRGVDVWMNVPRRPLEASGTSGQKVAMNGGLNFSVLDGWWIEGYDGENGFKIGPRENPENLSDDELDKLDADSLYGVLENEIIPMFYEKNQEGLPARWIARMKSSIKSLTHQFSSDRMVSDYLRDIYLK
ncbi:MAG: alpha-glucan family phosphorylase [Acidobacteriota bacterium]|nr:alpha-glucan family phosphorylase [Acidobacteriota bacterium]